MGPRCSALSRACHDARLPLFQASFDTARDWSPNDCFFACHAHIILLVTQPHNHTGLSAGLYHVLVSSGIELSPQHFNTSITARASPCWILLHAAHVPWSYVGLQTRKVRRLWDGSLGVACLARSAWHPGEEPQSWLPISDGSLDGQAATKLRLVDRLRFRSLAYFLL